MLFELGGALGIALVGSHGGGKPQGVVPECVELNDIAASRYHRSAVGGGVHPGHGLVASVAVEQSVVVGMEIGMLGIADVVDDFVYEGSVSFGAGLLAGVLGILLYGPYGPEQYVGLFDLVDAHAEGLAVHELAQSAHGGLHHQFKVVLLIDGEGQSGQRDKGVSGSALEPGIAGEQIAVFLLAFVELVGGVHEAVEEVVAR